MNEEVQEALSLIKQACASVVANLETHESVQKAIVLVEEELKKTAIS